MKLWKKFARWWSKQAGGEWHHHCDFMLEEGECFDLPTLNEVVGPVPKGERWKFHIHFCYYIEKE